MSTIRIAISGGPCSGKSSLLDLIRRENWDISLIGEAATMLNRNGIDMPECIKERDAFQKAIYTTQEAMEHCADVKHRPYIVDRTLFDGAAYFETVDEFRQITGASDPRPYDLIIFLAPPPARCYTTENNISRRENYDEAKKLSSDLLFTLRIVYANVEFVDGETFAEKMAHAVRLIRRTLGIK